MTSTAQVDRPQDVRTWARLTFSSELPGHACALNGSVDLEPGGFYVVSGPDGERVGRMSAYELPVLRPILGQTSTVLRRASEAEVARAAELAARQSQALNLCRQLTREFSLPLRPVTAFAPLDRDLVIVSFAAEERVDFRDLLREMNRRLHCRVELRQIGVRDQAKSAGGWGPCGRLMCCSSFMSRFNSVTIRMAKAQKLSLNPARISGMCGRLMCCLAHEAAPRSEATPQS